MSVRGLFQSPYLLLGIGLLAPFTQVVNSAATLSTDDQVAIINQINLHQVYIDGTRSYADAANWLSLYWPEATFTNTDKFGTSSRSGANISDDQGLKYFYDFDHSVFPLDDWFHSVGAWHFVDLNNTTATQAGIHWRWRVDWKANTTGVVSTGTYDDVFEKRNGTWKCLMRTSIADPNWSDYLFRPYYETASVRFQSSKP